MKKPHGSQLRGYGPRSGWKVSLWLVALGVLAVAGVQAGTAPILNPDNGNYYQEINNGTGLDWNSAAAAAEALMFQGSQGHLVTVTSAEEEGFLVANFDIGTTRYWVGASDQEVEGDWRWVTGEPFVYTNWGPGEPNNGVDDCMEYQPVGVAQWNDIPCSATVPDWIVEYEAPGVPTLPTGFKIALVLLLLVGGWILLGRRLTRAVT